MSGFIKSLFGTQPNGLAAETNGAAAAAAALERMGQPKPTYPATFKPSPADARMVQPEIFDPAVLHFPRGFRVGEARFTDTDVERAWKSARRRAMEHAVKLVATAPWADQVVLRGSVVLRAWLGEAAREPNDLDYVCELPADLSVIETFVVDLLTRVAASPTCSGGGPVVTLRAGDAASDDIWTYDRAPGRRVVVPWSAEGLPDGVVQVDLVSGEPLPVPPVVTELPLADGGKLPVRTASRELSLAWKLLWLTTDIHPQGKDLYDATLLAEQLVALDSPLELDLLREVIRAAAPMLVDGLTPSSFGVASHEWEHFPAEYPGLNTSLDDLCQRLTQALRPTFERSSS